MAKFITNQNIELQLELASVGDRVLAFLIDGLIILAYLFLMGIMTSTIQSDWSVIAFIPVTVYSLMFEAFGNGQTPGKRARDIQVVKLNGGSPTFVNYLLRWLMRPVDILILNGAVGLTLVIVTQNAQRLGDIVAGTTVIRHREQVTLEDMQAVHKEDHEVQFPQVRRLNDTQIALVRKALHRRRDGYGGEGVAALSGKIKEMLAISTDMPDVKFLYTIIADYEYLATR